MRLLPGATRALCKSATGVALGLVIINPEASAQQVPAAPSAMEARACAPTELVGAHSLSESFFQASLRASRASRHEVSFETRIDANPETAQSFADAARATSEAFMSIAGRPGGKPGLAGITSVVITQGVEPSASLAGAVLTITIVPARGLAGLPSTGQIERTVLHPPTGRLR